jgi:predicted DNA-binding protein (MmcQ/YjbR family)
MNLRAAQTFCRSLPGVTEDIKWEDHLVFSVGRKMFAAFNKDSGVPVGFKCSDMDFERLVKKKGIIPAPYAARFGWVSVTTASALSDGAARKQLRASYDLVHSCLPKKVQASIAGGAPAPRGRKVAAR